MVNICLFPLPLYAHSHLYVSHNTATQIIVGARNYYTSEPPLLLALRPEDLTEDEPKDEAEDREVKASLGTVVVVVVVLVAVLLLVAME